MCECERRMEEIREWIELRFESLQKGRGWYRIMEEKTATYAKGPSNGSLRELIGFWQSVLILRYRTKLDGESRSERVFGKLGYRSRNTR